MSRPPRHPSDPSPESPDDDPVWKLLDQAPPISPSPDFARRVLRATQTHRQSSLLPSAWLTRFLSPVFRPVFAVASLALVLTLAASWWRSSTTQRSPVAGPPAPAATTPSATTDETESLVEILADEIALLDDVDQLLDPQDGLDLEESDVDPLLF